MRSTDELDDRVRQMLRALEGPARPVPVDHPSRSWSRDWRLPRVTRRRGALALIAAAAVAAVVVGALTSSNDEGRLAGGGCGIVTFEGALYQGSGVLDSFGLQLADALGNGFSACGSDEGGQRERSPIPMRTVVPKDGAEPLDPAVAVGSDALEGLYVLAGRCTGWAYPEPQDEVNCLQHRLDFGASQYVATSLDEAPGVGNSLGQGVEHCCAEPDTRIELVSIKAVSPSLAVAKADDPRIVYLAGDACQVRSDRNDFAERLLACLTGH